MCGITGYITAGEPGADKLAALERMNSALAHRGPDSAGAYACGGVRFAMRRLSIIDIAGGGQPLYNEDSSLALVVNGEIYNYVELRAELESRGHVFKTRSDCETILHLYEELGEGCLVRLRGMFALALHDRRRGEVFLARDRMGEKPLYYSFRNGELVFASEMKSLLTCLRPGGLEVDAGAVNQYLHYQYVPEPRTCVKGVAKLPAAHYAKVRVADMSFTLKRYWDMEDAAPVAGKPAALIRERFEELGRLIIRSDVPVGVALSGGLDSSAIACAVARHSPRGMKAFTVGYPASTGDDERAEAGWLAGKLGMEFCSEELGLDGLERAFPALVGAMDDPIADVAAYGYYAVSRLARAHGVPVLLLGFGGDELFWGYNWAIQAVGWNERKSRLRGGGRPAWLPPGELIRAFSRAEKRSFLRRPAGTLSDIAAGFAELAAKYNENPDRLILWDENPDFRSAFKLKSGLFSPDFMSGVSDAELYEPFTTPDWRPLPVKITKFLFDPWNVSNSVTLGDRLGMAASIEPRLPFLDHEFVELVVGLRKANPGDHLLGQKAWFREAMSGLVPGEVLGRRKAGFMPPRQEWLSALVKKYRPLCLDGALVEMGLVERARLEKALSPGGKPEDLFFAYKLLLLGMWLDIFVRDRAGAGMNG